MFGYWALPREGNERDKKVLSVQSSARIWKKNLRKKKEGVHVSEWVRSTIRTRSVAELNEAEHRVQYLLAAKKRRRREQQQQQKTHTLVMLDLL